MHIERLDPSKVHIGVFTTTPKPHPVFKPPILHGIVWYAVSVLFLWPFLPMLTSKLLLFYNFPCINLEWTVEKRKSSRLSFLNFFCMLHSLRGIFQKVQIGQELAHEILLLVLQVFQRNSSLANHKAEHLFWLVGSRRTYGQNFLRNLAPA